MTSPSGGLLNRGATVLFDLDGTLLDTAPDLVAALLQVCAEEGQPAPDPDAAACYVSRGAIGLVTFAFPHQDSATLERLRARLVEIYQQDLCSRTQPYPGMVSVLDALSERGVQWGIVTNKLRFLAEPLVAEVGIAQDCAVVIGGDCASHSKPHPAPINLAMARMGATAADTVYVGDAEKDIVAGRAAGTCTVAVTWGYIIPGEEPTSWGADFVIAKPDELLTL